MKREYRSGSPPDTTWRCSQSRTRWCRQPNVDSGAPRQTPARARCRRPADCARSWWWTESACAPAPQAFFTHQPSDALLTDMLARLVQVLPHARSAITTVTLLMRRANGRPELPVASDPVRLWSPLPGVEPARRDAQRSTTFATVKSAFSAAIQANLTAGASRRRPRLFLGCRAPSAARDSFASPPTPHAPRSQAGPAVGPIRAGPLNPLPQRRLRQIEIARGAPPFCPHRGPGARRRL